MRIVVSGTHASGKSTLISDFASRHPEYDVLGDPFEEIADEGFVDLDAALFRAQLELAVLRLEETAEGSNVIVERGPMDFVAYLTALDRLGRHGRSSASLRAGLARAEAVADRIDLWVLLPLDDGNPITVSEDEDPALRAAMNDALLDLADDAGPTGARVVELTGDPTARLLTLERAVEPSRRTNSPIESAGI
ncbi:AAA family ATPase [Demequina sp. SYSU T00192]|uniref:AAA family ATPase n=1 Tax=Demequina litoralis TaxID=3051660 RepID=A0ABT8GCZ7_9MICO|nr:AAA family ATPase [Demequina sp. SYSU T00192]MDN4476999.1 AAA family ATPase [Demequina sp. SYSU T00192]